MMIIDYVWVQDLTGQGIMNLRGPQEALMA